MKATNEYGIVSDVLISRCSSISVPFFGSGYLLSGSKNFQLFTKIEIPQGWYTIILRPID